MENKVSSGLKVANVIIANTAAPIKKVIPFLISCNKTNTGKIMATAKVMKESTYDKLKKVPTYEDTSFADSADEAKMNKTKATIAIITLATFRPLDTLFSMIKLFFSVVINHIH